MKLKVHLVRFIVSIAILMPLKSLTADNGDSFSTTANPVNTVVVTGEIFAQEPNLIVHAEEVSSGNHEVVVEFEFIATVNSKRGNIIRDDFSVPATEFETQILNPQTGQFEILTETQASGFSIEQYLESNTGRVVARRRYLFANDGSVLFFEPLRLETASIPFDSTVTLPTSAESSNIQNGVLDDLFASDASSLIFESNNNHPVVVEFSASICGSDADNPGKLELLVEAGVDSPNVSQILSVFNWRLGEYQQIDNSNASLTNSISVLDLSTSVFDYLSSGSAEVRWQVMWMPNGQTNSPNWKARVDQTLWLTEINDTPIGVGFFAAQQRRIDEFADLLSDPSDVNARRIYRNFDEDYPATVNPEFWLGDLDFSGTSWSQLKNPGESTVFNPVINDDITFTGVSASPTLLTRQVFVFATHVPVREGQRSYLWIGADGNRENGIEVEKVHQVHGDLSIGKLAQPIRNETIKHYRIAPFHRIDSSHFASDGQLEDAKVILSDQDGEIFLGKIVGSDSSLQHSPLTLDSDFPTASLHGGDSSNPLFLLAPDDELLLVSSNSSSNSSQWISRNIEEINAYIQSPDGFDLPNDKVEVYKFRVLPGDVNSDDVVDLTDVDPFVAAVLDGRYEIGADINQDGVVDLSDVPLFVDIVLGT